MMMMMMMMMIVTVMVVMVCDTDAIIIDYLTAHDLLAFTTRVCM